jgi:hypothetical protein
MRRVLKPRWVEGAVLGKPVPGFKDEAPGAVLTIGLDLVFLQYAEGLARVIRAHDLLRVEDVAQLIAREAVEIGEIGVEFGLEERAAVGVPMERWPIIAEIEREWPQIFCNIGQLKYTRFSKRYIYIDNPSRRQNGNCSR